MVFEIVGNSERTRAGLSVHVRIGVVRFNPLEPQLHFANGIAILVDSTAVGRSERALQPLHGSGDGVQNAAIFARLSSSLLRVLPFAEEALENETRIILH